METIEKEVLTKQEFEELKKDKSLKLTGAAAVYLYGYSNGHNRPTVFKAGIRDNISLECVDYNQDQNAVDLRFKDNSDNINYTRIYGANKQYYANDEEGYHRTLANKINLLISILNIAYYPNVLNPELIDGAEWDQFCKIISDEYHAKVGADTKYVAGVWTVNKGGYVGLRQSWMRSICAMAELEDSGSSAKEFFEINEKYDNFEMPKLESKGNTAGTFDDESEDDLPF